MNLKIHIWLKLFFHWPAQLLAHSDTPPADVVVDCVSVESGRLFQPIWGQGGIAPAVLRVG